MIYLDWAATAIPDTQLISTYASYIQEYGGNPSSLHAIGLKAKNALDEARSRLETTLGVCEGTIIFTSGGTESNNIIAHGVAHRPGTPEILTSKTEHASMREPLIRLSKNQAVATYVAVDSAGIIKPGSLLKKLTPDTRLVTILAVNNETGAIQPVEQLVHTIRNYNKETGGKIHVHIDCVQALGKISMPAGLWDADSASFSIHKLGGPKGIGLLYLKTQQPGPFAGGGQEFGVRPGTENVAAALCAADCVAKAVKEQAENERKAGGLMDALLKGVSGINGSCVFPEDRLTAGDKRFSPWILSFAAPPLPGEVVTRLMNDAGFAAGTGSACSSRRNNISHVLSAMGIDAQKARSQVRVSTGPETRSTDITAFIEALTSQTALYMPKS